MIKNMMFKTSKVDEESETSSENQPLETPDEINPVKKTNPAANKILEKLSETLK
jgi:hypothetical protein